jgi:hypothetical protein
MTLDETKLEEILAEYQDGYEKAYKHIPDLIKEIRELRSLNAEGVRVCAQCGSHLSEYCEGCR